MDRATRTIPVIVCTAAAKLVEELQTHLDSLHVAVALKPFDIDHLMRDGDPCWSRPRGVISHRSPILRNDPFWRRWCSGVRIATV